MEKYADNIHQHSPKRLNIAKFLADEKGTVYFIIGLTMICVAWYFAANAINKSIILPYFLETMQAFFSNWTDPIVLKNLAITLKRVFRGFLNAVLIGLPLGLLMGYSKTIMEALSPLINSIRQVPIMAWVPLSIIWFGLGDGPTVFLITMTSIFPLLLNTMSGVMSIDPNYKYAARSMGAGTVAIFKDVIFPGALPNFLVGCRLALGLAWMSVICAEFIATSEGFGFLLIESQVRMETAQLYSLMIMSAVIGYFIDRVLLLIERNLTLWRFKDAASHN
jgi:NitT/TauT family transport system permease protein